MEAAAAGCCLVRDSACVCVCTYLCIFVCVCSLGFGFEDLCVRACVCVFAFIGGVCSGEVVHPDVGI